MGSGAGARSRRQQSFWAMPAPKSVPAQLCSTLYMVRFRPCVLLVLSAAALT